MKEGIFSWDPSFSGAGICTEHIVEAVSDSDRRSSNHFHMER